GCRKARDVNGLRCLYRRMAVGAHRMRPQPGHLTCTERRLAVRAHRMRPQAGCHLTSVVNLCLAEESRKHGIAPAVRRFFRYASGIDEVWNMKAVATKVKGIWVEKYGGPDVMSFQDVEIAPPGPGQALVRIHASGVNFIDIYQRRGRYTANLPYTPGLEASGVVEEVGEGVHVVK